MYPDSPECRGQGQSGGVDVTAPSLVLKRLRFKRTGMFQYEIAWKPKDNVPKAPCSYIVCMRIYAHAHMHIHMDICTILMCLS